MKYDFTLKFKLPNECGDHDVLLDRLADAGCTDALIGIGQPGRIGLDFCREARAAEEAIVSAIESVKRAIPGARLIEVGPDFVGLTDVADLVGVSRQNMRKLMIAHGDSFPAPVHEGSPALWHLAPVLQWLRERGTYRIETETVDVAHVAMQVNLAKQSRNLESRYRDQELAALFA